MTGRPDAPAIGPLGALHAHVEGYLAEDDVLLAARAEADALGCAPIGPGGGRRRCGSWPPRSAPGRWSRSAPAAGVSGLWLLRGMAPDGVLTSIDVDPENQRAARGRVHRRRARRRPGCG